MLHLRGTPEVGRLEPTKVAGEKSVTVDLDLLIYIPATPARAAGHPLLLYLVVTGISMGGYGTWSLLLTHPERFAAAVPISGGAPSAIPSMIPPRQLELIRSVPVRAYHGANDGVVPASESVWITDELRALGCDVKLTLYRRVGHDAWTRTYANQELWAWLGERRRASRGR